jgi:hypothetical protein
MRTFDFAPLYRSTVGLDRMFSMLDEVAGFDSPAPSYPPYNQAIHPTILSEPARTPIGSRSQLPALPTLISRSRRRRTG